MTLVFDTSVLSCFARACRLPMLDRLTAGGERRVTTMAVLEELGNGAKLYPQLAEVAKQKWLEGVPVDSLDELRYFAEYAKRLVDSKGRNVGEASALAWVKAHGGVLLADDQTAVVFAREQGIPLKRSLALICDGIRADILSQSDAGILVDELIVGGARFPCKGGSAFLQWANCEGLLDP